MNTIPSDLHTVFYIFKWRRFRVAEDIKELQDEISESLNGVGWYNIKVHGIKDGWCSKHVCVDYSGVIWDTPYLGVEIKSCDVVHVSMTLLFSDRCLYIKPKTCSSMQSVINAINQELCDE